jgi:hypothetical protein
MDTTPNLGIGMTDAMHAARAEARRVMDANKGDLVGEHKVLLTRLTDAAVISDEESRTLLELYRLGYEAGEAKGEPRSAFFRSREIYDRMAADGKAGPVALVLASAALGAFELEESPEGTPTVVVYKRSYAQSGAAIGAGIGALLGGAGGAILGGEIGGLIGGIVDEKKDDKKK